MHDAQDTRFGADTVKLHDPRRLREAEDVARRIVALPPGNGRRVVAVAGPPASGKSELSGVLTALVNRAGRRARRVPMDGFHLDNRLLEERRLLARKGAPETFDAHGFIALVERMKTGGEIVYPRFDRARDIAVAGAGFIESDCDVAIVEGNYLLFDETPWHQLAPMWDLSVWLEVPEAVLTERCVQRWLDHAHTLEAARERTERNDLPNGRRIIEARLPADLTLTA